LHMMTEEIELVDIEGELKRLTDEELGKKRTRACFFNLIIYAQKNERQPYYSSLIDGVLAKFPCRVFFITSEVGQRDYLRTHVTTKTLAEGIFCEVIHIDFSGSLGERVPFILLPHIIPDLPLYLFLPSPAVCDAPPAEYPAATRHPGTANRKPQTSREYRTAATDPSASCPIAAATR